MTYLSIFTAGFTALAAQIILIREILAVFHGNEITLGLILGSWLISGGLGSATASYFLSKNNPGRFFNSVQLALGILIPLSIFIIMIMPRILGMFPGEIVSAVSVWLAVFPAIFVLNGLLGSLFPAGCAILQKEKHDFSVKTVYILEGAGSLAGGFASILVFHGSIDPLRSAIILSAVNIICVLGKSRKIVLSAAASILLGVVLFYFFASRNIMNYTTKLNYPGYEPVFETYTKYQDVKIMSSDGTLSFFSDGIYNFSEEDIQTAEFAAHIPLTMHEHPDSVLLIGGGFSGISQQILKHPVKNLVYIELDPEIPELLSKYFTAPSDSRFSMIIEDARRWLARTKKRFDVIIVRMPPPYTFLINRYYTAEFFELVSQHLKKAGVFSFSIPSSPNYLSKEQRQLLVCLKKTILKAFTKVLITPGETAYFVASDNSGKITRDWKKMNETAEQRGIKAVFFNSSYLFSDFSHERFNRIEHQLKYDAGIRENRDFAPVSSYYNSVLWSSHFSNIYINILRMLSPALIYVLMALALAGQFIMILISRDRKKVALCLATAVTGASELSLQFLTILVFQILFGSVFWRVGGIFTSFMAGLIAGAAYSAHVRGKTYAILKNVHVSLTFYTVLLLGVTLLHRNIPVPEAAFILMPLIPGFLGGIQLPLAAEIYRKEFGLSPSAAGGMFYFLDMAGSFLGCILCALFIVPITGIIPAAVFFIFLNVGQFILMALTL